MPHLRIIEVIHVAPYGGKISYGHRGVLTITSQQDFGFGVRLNKRQRVAKQKIAFRDKDLLGTI